MVCVLHATLETKNGDEKNIYKVCVLKHKMETKLHLVSLMCLFSTPFCMLHALKPRKDYPKL